MAETFPQRLRRMRLRMGMTQSQLADMCYVHENSIFGYESGRTTPSADVLCTIADAFDVSVDYLLCRTENPITL